MTKLENKEKQGVKNVADEVLGALHKVVPGVKSFFNKLENSKTFGPQMHKIREEIKKRFGGSKHENRP